MKKIILSLAILLVLPALAFAYFQPATLTNGIERIAVFTQEQAQKYFGMGYVLEDKVGASIEHTQREFFRQSLTTGGNLATSSTAATFTITNKELLPGTNVIQWTPNVSNTLTFGATSSKILVPKIGDVANVYFLNASSTAGATITFAAADTNLDLQMAEATGGDLVLSGLDWAKLTFIRTSAAKVALIFDEMTEAD